MIEFAKITGKTDNNWVQVMMRTGENIFAPIVVMGTDVSVPSDVWIKNNKDNFLAVVAYEKDNFNQPMIIGFYPVKGAKSAEYNTTERLLEVTLELVQQLIKTRVNTSFGPQNFMPDTIIELKSLKATIEDIKRNINSIKL